MSWFLLVLAAVFLLSSVGTVLSVGEERKPLTPSRAAVVVSLNVVLALLTLATWLDVTQ